MNILIDGLPLFLNDWDLGEYSREIVSSLSSRKEVNIHLIKDLEISIKDKSRIFEGAKIFNCTLNRKGDNYAPILDYMDKNNINTYHCMNNGFSFNSDMRGKRCISSFNHLIPIEYEEFYREDYKKKYFSSLYRTLEVSDKIICPSNTMKNDLIKMCNISKEKLSVIYPGVLEDFAPLNPYMSRIYIKSKFNLEGDFILCSGDFHKRKQFETILEVFSSILEEDKNVLLVFLININNFNIDYFNEIITLSNLMGIGGSIRFISNFTPDDKVHFFNSAACYMDLSLYDSLNYSILQALSCKCPIICSDIKLFRELLGNNGIFIDLENDSIPSLIKDYFFNLEFINLYSNEDFQLLREKYSLSNSIFSLISLYSKGEI